MTSFVDKIKELFFSKEKKFAIALFKELETKNFVDLRKIPSKLTIQQRYKTVTKLQSSSDLYGILLSEKLLFLSIENEDLTTLKRNLKEVGTVKLAELKERWKLKDNILKLVLKNIEKGFIGEKLYYSSHYLQNYFTSLLKKEDETDLIEICKELGIEDSIILPFIQEMIDNSLVFGVIKNQHTFIDSEAFSIIIAEYLEEIDETETEIEYNKIANDLGVLSSNLEPYLVSYVEKTPGRFVVYPLEKKLDIKH